MKSRKQFRNSLVASGTFAPVFAASPAEIGGLTITLNELQAERHRARGRAARFRRARPNKESIGGTMRTTIRKFLVACLLLITSAPGIAQDYCKDVLVYAGRNYFSQFSREESLAWLYSKKCRGETKSAGGGIDVIIDSIPIGADYNESRQSQWCEENKRLASYRASAQRIESSVSVPALQNWSSCVAAFAKSLESQVVYSPNEAVVQIRLTNRSPNPETLTHIGIQSDEPNGISCTPVLDSANKTIQLPPARTVSINCVRSFVEVTRNDKRYEILPGGSITLATSLTPFLYGYPEKMRTTPPQIPSRIMISLKGAHVGTHSYWSNGNRLTQCSDYIQPPSEDFELIEIGVREVDAFGKGMCSPRGHCDSLHEYCKERYFTNACYINKEWHEWYKKSSGEQGVPYSKEAVCGDVG